MLIINCLYLSDLQKLTIKFIIKLACTKHELVRR